MKLIILFLLTFCSTIFAQAPLNDITLDYFVSKIKGPDFTLALIWRDPTHPNLRATYAELWKNGSLLIITPNDGSHQLQVHRRDKKDTFKICVNQIVLDTLSCSNTIILDFKKK